MAQTGSRWAGRCGVQVVWGQHGFGLSLGRGLVVLFMFYCLAQRLYAPGSMGRAALICCCRWCLQLVMCYFAQRNYEGGPRNEIRLREVPWVHAAGRGSRDAVAPCENGFAVLELRVPSFRRRDSCRAPDEMVCYSAG